MAPDLLNDLILALSQSIQCREFQIQQLSYLLGVRPPHLSDQHH